MYNCLFTCTGNVYCIGAGYVCNIYAECNAFIGVNEPWRLWATRQGYTDYNITITNNLGADDVKASSGDAPFYVPTYNYRKYDASMVLEVVGNQQAGAGATMGGGEVNFAALLRALTFVISSLSRDPSVRCLDRLDMTGPREYHQEPPRNVISTVAERSLETARRGQVKGMLI